MLEALQHVRIDRIAFQRAICASSGGCVGLGAIDGFYSGYLAAVLAAANKSHIPVYFRWGWRDKELRPLYFSPVSPTLYSGATPPPTDLPSIKIEQTMCFERVLRSEPTSFGAVPSISTGTASRVKKAAYTLVARPPIPETRPTKSPHTILLYYRRGKQRPLSPTRKRGGGVFFSPSAFPIASLHRRSPRQRSQRPRLSTTTQSCGRGFSAGHCARGVFDQLHVATRRSLGR